LASLAFVILTGLFGPWYVFMLTIPLMIYNVQRFMNKEYKMYFITRREYSNKFSKMELQFKIKAIYYGFMFAGSLVMLILTLIDFVSAVV
jgi:hypothetical protein